MSIRHQTEEIKDYANIDSDTARDDAMTCALGMVMYWQSIYDELQRN